MSRVNKYRGKRIGKEAWIVGFYTQLPKVSLGATIVADGELCAEDVADYIIVNKPKQHPDFSNSYPLEIVECEQYEVDPDTVGQYIGVSDRNGKEIYEGDIVKIHQFLFDGFEYEKEIIVSIEYMEDMACFGANLLQAREIRTYMGYDNETDKKEKVVVPLFDFYGLHEESFEVIGNVYENSDLLKEAGNEQKFDD